MRKTKNYVYHVPGLSLHKTSTGVKKKGVKKKTCIRPIMRDKRYLLLIETEYLVWFSMTFKSTRPWRSPSSMIRRKTFPHTAILFNIWLEAEQKAGLCKSYSEY